MKDRFDSDAFYSAIDRTLRTRQVNWKHVSEATGVSPTTLTRMAQGRRPDAGSLAALSAWAGINPANYVPNGGADMTDIGTLEQVGRTLRADASLSEEARRRLESIFESAYLALREA